jgi:spermidine/putrescine-binding protein
MDRSRALHRATGGALSRRQVTKALAATGLVFAAIPLARQSARAADQAIYFNWAGYDDLGFHPACVEKHGVSPELPILADVEEALSKIRGGYEVEEMHPCNLDLVRWRDAGVLQPIDTGRLVNWSDLFDELIDAMTAPEAGKRLIEAQDYGHSNRKTFALVDDALLAERGLAKDPGDMLSKGIMQKAIGNQDTYQQMFELVKAGV